MNKLIMLGTGNALSLKYYNTCFVIKNDKCLLVDAGGGNGILKQLKEANISFESLNAMIITHNHTDHVLGAIWVIRYFIQHVIKKNPMQVLTIYGHDDVTGLLKIFCSQMFTTKQQEAVKSNVIFCQVASLDKYEINGNTIEFFDLFSTKMKQYGFKMTWANQVLVCLGDEPLDERNEHFVKNANYVLCEAFCLKRDKDIFKPYEKHHSTAYDAGCMASRLNIKHLLLYHTEEETFGKRKELYTEEVKTVYHGKIDVLDDLETLELEEE